MIDKMDTEEGPTNLLATRVKCFVSGIYRPEEWAVVKMNYQEKCTLFEDFLVDDEVVPTLEELAVRVIARDYPNNPKIAHHVPLHNYELFCHFLDTSIDPVVTAQYIDDGLYWKRCLHDKFPEEQVYPIWKTDDSWKRLFLERFLGEYLENLEPGYIDYTEVVRICQIMNPFVSTLRIRKLKAAPYIEDDKDYKGLDNISYTSMQRPLHIRKRKKGKVPERVRSEGSFTFETPAGGKQKLLRFMDEVVDEELWDDLSYIPDRLDLSQVLPHLTQLTKLSVELGMTNYGKPGACPGAYCQDMALINMNDAKRISTGIASSQIQSLTINRSQLTKAGLIRNLLCWHKNWKYICSLDLSYCQINDEGAAILADLAIAKNPILASLILKDNDISGTGATAIATALSLCPSPPLNVLNLSLNFIGILGAEGLGKAVRSNRNLKHLLLGGCDLEDTGAIAIISSLSINKSLLVLDLSSNARLTDKTGVLALSILEARHRLNQLDLRGSGVSPNILDALRSALVYNRHRYRRDQPFLDQPPATPPVPPTPTPPPTPPTNYSIFESTLPSQQIEETDKSQQDVSQENLDQISQHDEAQELNPLQ